MNQPSPAKLSLDDYPRSFASIDDMRLASYTHLSVAEQERVFHALERFCIARAEQVSPRRDFDGYAFLGAGWEWSVFRKDANTVIKVPSGVFPETNDPRYLANVERIYTLLARYYPPEMLAATSFRRENGLNVVEQQFIDGDEGMVVPYDLDDRWLLERLVVFFEATASLIDEVRWMPDFWLTDLDEGFRLRNVLVDRGQHRFAIIDVSQYLDPCRMYPALRDACCASFSERVQDLLAWANRRLQELPARTKSG